MQIVTALESSNNEAYGVTKVTDITVSETDNGQWIICQLSAAVGVPKGTYKVRIASHGLDPTDPLTVATLTVTLVEAIPEPTPTKRVTIDVLQVVNSHDLRHRILRHRDSTDRRIGNRDTGGKRANNRKQQTNRSMLSLKCLRNHLL